MLAVSQPRGQGAEWPGEFGRLWLTREALLALLRLGLLRCHALCWFSALGSACCCPAGNCPAHLRCVVGKRGSASCSPRAEIRVPPVRKLQFQLWMSLGTGLWPPLSERVQFRVYAAERKTNKRCEMTESCEVLGEGEAGAGRPLDLPSLPTHCPEPSPGHKPL